MGKVASWLLIRDPRRVQNEREGLHRQPSAGQHGGGRGEARTAEQGNDQGS